MATTINAANVSIGFDASKLRQGGQFTRSEIANIRKTMTEAVPMSERLAGSINALERAFQAGAIDADKYGRAVELLKNKMRDLDTASRQTTASKRTLGSELTLLAGRYLAVGTAVAGIKQSLSLALEADQAKTSLQVLTGSADQAERLFNEFKRLDRESPLSFSAFQDASKVMMQFGVTTRQVTPLLESMSRISLGNQQNMHAMALAFGQVSAAGRLTGQEVLQFINAGFNPLQQISKDTGISMAQLRKEMEAGAISVGMVERAFINATREGTKLYNANEALAKSPLGQLRKAETDAKMLATAIGAELIPAMTSLLKLFNELNATGKDGGGGMLTGAARFLSDGVRMVAATGTDVFNSLAANGKPLERSAIEDLMNEVNQREVDRLTEEYKKQFLVKTLEIEPIIEKFTKPVFEVMQTSIEKAARKMRAPLELISELEKNAEKMLSIQEKRDERLTDLQKNFDDWLKDSSDRTALNPNMAPAIKAGTQEAFKFLQDREKAKEDRQLEIARQQKKLQESQLKVQQDTLKEIKKLPKLRSAG